MAMDRKNLQDTRQQLKNIRATHDKLSSKLNAGETNHSTASSLTQSTEAIQNKIKDVKAIVRPVIEQQVETIPLLDDEKLVALEKQALKFQLPPKKIPIKNNSNKECCCFPLFQTPKKSEQEQIINTPYTSLN